MDKIKTDICVIGSGAAGLSVAAGAVQMGAKVVLIERNIRDGVMGGDCLHTGCVPSKALLAAGKHAKAMGTGAKFGIAPQPADVDFGKVNDHVQGVINTIAPIDSVERYENLGVKVINASARFVGPREVEAGETRVRAKFFVVATGSIAAVPPIPGLNQVPYLTNETIFDLRQRPEHLIIIGGGPIGMEMAQAHRRLGSEVTVLEGDVALSKDDPELTAIVKASLREDGVALYEQTKVQSVAAENGGVTVTVERSGKTEFVTGSHVLVATGRAPTVEGLGLDAAGIEYTKRGIKVDARLRSTNKRVFAIGDVAGGLQFTHVAGYHAGIVIRNALYRMPTKADLSAVPWVTYTDPELAHVGLTESQAKEQLGDGKFSVTRWEFAENDRAQAERETRGLIKAVIAKNGKILGATIVGAQAGELIQTWVLAISAGLKISALTAMIAPYPTLGEVSKRAAGAFYTDFLFGPRNKMIVKTLLKLP